VKNKQFFQIIRLALVLTIVAGAIVGCTQKSSTLPAISSSTTTSPQSTSTANITSVTTNTVVFQSFHSFAADFRAFITFTVSNTTASYPTELAVPQVPVTWNGLSFSGNLQESGPGEDITDEVSGTVSPDGNTLSQLIYSRKIMRTTNTGTYFSITLRGVPLNAGLITGLYSFSGALLQQYVITINYMDGPIVSGQIEASTAYLSTDWANTQQMPALTLTFGN
jgi:hypothetical protein